MGSLEGRVACITGGTRGIGFAVARALHDEGAAVVVSGRSQEKGEAAVAQLGGDTSAAFVASDAKRREDCEALIDTTVERFGRIDVLVANAGGASGHAQLADLSDEAFDDTLRWNLWHTFWTMRRALRYMLPQEHGRIVNISSLEGKVGKPGMAHYVTAKHAINGLTKSTAREVGTRGVTVNAICPGAIETDIMKAEAPAAAEAMGMTYEELKEQFARESAIKRLNEVEDVAAVAVLLASDVGGGITGSLISVDGGTAPY